MPSKLKLKTQKGLLKGAVCIRHVNIIAYPYATSSVLSAERINSVVAEVPDKDPAVSQQGLQDNILYY